MVFTYVAMKIRETSRGERLLKPFAARLKNKKKISKNLGLREAKFQKSLVLLGRSQALFQWNNRKEVLRTARELAPPQPHKVQG